jgi:hypothetical protein|tara:strand:- start:464 stop:1237 length:774 start_codon:yes stop_codon:yes gene_type:complete
MSKKKSSNATFVDPVDFEDKGELVTPQKTPESAFIPDTNGDPEGSEERARKDSIVLPTYYYDKYDIDNEGKPVFRSSRVKAIMDVFHAKKATPLGFATEDQKIIEKEQQKFDLEVELVVSGIKPLLDIDPQTTGYNYLTLATRTWAEFVSIAYEYNESMNRSNPVEELPTWLIEREAKMWALGRKARLVREAILAVDNLFGIGDLGIQPMRVQTEVERRQQRMAEWNFNNLADNSEKVAKELNSATLSHAKQVFTSA